MACSKASSVRAAFARKSVLTFDQHASLGEKSGEYGGRESRRTPAAAHSLQTDAEPGYQGPQGALTLLVGLHDPET